MSGDMLDCKFCPHNVRWKHKMHVKTTCGLKKNKENCVLQTTTTTMNNNKISKQISYFTFTTYCKNKKKSRVKLKCITYSLSVLN